MVRKEIAEVVAEVGLPAVIASTWPAALRATADTIRAALYSGEAEHEISRSWSPPQVGLLRDDGRSLSAGRDKKGWIVRLGSTGERPDFVAARSGSKYIGSHINMSRGRMSRFLFDGYDRFNWREVEEMMLEFISRPANPRSAQWVGLDWGGR